MRIKKIEIEGFKSYSQREVVDNLDPQFNAITGLNGSGKSNILDAICFLLGITNLSNVRAHTLTDLVFKLGQAGINRATVTITFDNNVPLDEQPTGYDKFREIVVKRQIIINGRNTYQINGTMATNQRVSDLFRMVGINVNNPHFLIMQGRIAKVLNMKPMEILSMVEEAAGVRMYECKKLNALKTLEKKDAKVEEISRLLTEDILPCVERLRKDRENYLEYQRIEKELEFYQRKLYAYDFYNSQLQVSKLDEKKNEIQSEVRQLVDTIEELQDQIKKEKETLQKMEQEKANQIGPEHKNLEKALKGFLNEQTKIASENDDHQAQLTELQTAITRKNKSIENDETELEKKCQQLTRAEMDNGNHEVRGKKAEETIMRARQKLEALARGMTTDNEGNAVTLDTKLRETRTKLAERETNIKKAEMRLNQLKNLLDKKKNDLHQMTRRSSEDESIKEQMKDEIAKIENDLQSMNYEPNHERRLEEEQGQLNKRKNELLHEIEKNEERYFHLQFNYRNPHPDFDQTKVKGIAAKLFKLKDPKFATALEVVGGGKIYNVVVDKAETAKMLLEKKCLQNRVTILPLDKIEARGVVMEKQIHEAKNMIGNDSVFVPIELIEYPPELKSVMQYIFGNSLICLNMEQANQLTYKNPRVNCRTVTLSGEDYNPRGVLTGGSRNTKASVLQALYNMSEQYEQLDMINQRLQIIRDEQVSLRPIRQKYDDLNNKLIEKKKRLDAINEGLKRSPVELLRVEIQQLENDKFEADEIIRIDSPEIEALTKLVDELENQKKDGNFQMNEKKKANKELADAQKELDDLKGTFSQAKELLAALREEITLIKKSISDEKVELDQMAKSEEKKHEEIDNFSIKVIEINEKVMKAQHELDQYNKETRLKDKNIRTKTTEIEDLKKKLRQFEHKQQSKEKDAEEATKNSKEFLKRAQQLEKVHKWISEEKDKFGNENTFYNFNNYTFEIGKREIESRKDRNKELLQTINTKAMKLLDTAEEQCNELGAKHAQLGKDKRQLKEAIEQLDEKKKRELLAAHKQISSDFGAIYSTLLPGANAELVPPTGAMNCLSGLEVRVAFNNKYKDSLSELSGGQRSLVALSLILAMLKFKPAPFYILDEIDAALDMSHTENIGKMIKNHFSQSQFIVVSLKQGFFDNANVVYRVQFKDGRSTITRTENENL